EIRKFKEAFKAMLLDLLRIILFPFYIMFILCKLMLLSFKYTSKVFHILIKLILKPFKVFNVLVSKSRLISKRRYTIKNNERNCDKNIPTKPPV
ncbi:MAG: hypothetical protein ACOCUI_02165, partial [bacterium]